MLQVEADLVGAAGDGAGFDEGEIVFSFEHCEVGFGVFGFAGGIIWDDAVAAVFFGIRTEAGVAGPFLFFGISADDGEVAFLHAAGFEEVAPGADGAGAFGEEEDAGGFGIEAVDVFQEAEIAGTGPERAADDGRGNGELEVAAGLVPIVGNEHPARGLVDREDGTVFVEDGDGSAVGQDDLVAVLVLISGRARHGRRLEKKPRMDTNKHEWVERFCLSIRIDVARRLRDSHELCIPAS